MSDDTLEVMAIIPARGGSKGIPGKNIQPVGGKPLLAHSVEQARFASRVSRVIVSTDDERIAGVARAYGAEVAIRPADISGDEATSEVALAHTLQTLADSEDYRPDLVVFLQCTSPLRRVHDIDSAIKTLLDAEADSLFSASVMHGFVWRIEATGVVDSFSYDYRQRQRRQDAPQDVIENGSIYIFKPRILHETGNRLGGKIAVYYMHPLDSLQVDEPGDLGIMNQLFTVRRPELSSPVLANVKLLVLDFDGVLTDNRVLVDEQGIEAVWCSRSDGWGIARAKEAGIEVMVLSSEVNPVVAARCKKLDIACVQGVGEKRTVLEVLVSERGLSLDEVAYVGNDVNDLSCLQIVGLPLTVADAHPGVLKEARWVLSKPGGHGAVRELCDMLLEAKDR